jgi:3-hydroxyacyl-[acyl-carrier-protein] dehydratase
MIARVTRVELRPYEWVVVVRPWPATRGYIPAVPSSEDLVGLLPHRPPFRFVDAVDEHRPGESIRARYRVTGEEMFLAGHFPGNPVLPGVIQLEALAQAGAIAVLADERYAGRLPLFGGVEKARFRRIVRPGDEVVLEVTLERLSARGGWGSGRATVDGEVCCEARLLFALGAAEGS